MLSPLDFLDYCPACGGTIDRAKPHAAKRVYCCIECSRAEYHQMEKIARLEAKKDRPPCRRCGAPVPVGKLSRAVYCSKACQSAEFFEGRKNARLEAKAQRSPCRHCGAPVAAWKYGGALFCSEACRSAGAVAKWCDFCGEAFKGIARRKYCSLTCAARHRQARRRFA
ncbi:hypothetical protein O7A70_30850 [Mesorhizobium sp. Cs1299R1N1]|uniref:hypothetical protein n=1 Tax=Mesorhizobium sp. Cs1299R1N1 TaxID=3015172 RepID=UPI00301DA14A